uniref:DNA damage-binding protein 1 n=1 Tax=Ditylenchus dipsaci TaxID=166011 RepID=A0A915DC56_9BILA
MLLLVKEFGKDEIKDLKIELLGSISSPECLVYLDNSVAFVGSRYGDSQLVKLSTEPVDPESNSFVDVIDSYNNLGPIRDLVIINSEGQNQVITCSGAFKDGSLRIIRSGIGIDTLASVELAGVKGLFLLRLDSEYDRYMVVTFADITHLLLLDGEEMEDTQLPDFELSQPTLYAGNFTPNRIIQITADNVRLISGDGSFKVGWQSSSKITLCSVNSHSGQILLGSGDQIIYLQIANDQIQLVNQVTCQNEIACLDISPIEEKAVSKVFAVGFWNDQSVALYSLEPEMKLVSEEKLSGEVLPRSLLIIAMEGIIYLLVALGDGTVYYFRINAENGCLTEQKKVTLGTQPTLLKKFVTKGSEASLLQCKLEMVNQVAQLNSDYYKESLVMSDGENLIIGTIDDIQKLHIRTIPLYECVSRIAYQPETNTIAILTSRIEYVLADGQRSYGRESVSTMCSSKTAQTQVDKSNAPRSSSYDDADQQCEVEVHSLCVLDANSFECLYVYELAKMEIGCSLCTASLADDLQPYFAVGTSFVYGEDTESKQGRILIFQVQNNVNSAETGKLRLVAEKEVKGAVYSMTTLSNKLICCINTSVRLFEWTIEKELRLECSHFNFITALYIKTKGDLVLAADLMKSICLLSYKAIDSSFEEIARDYASEWMCACEIIDSDTFLGGENHFNIFVLKRM